MAEPLHLLLVDVSGIYYAAHHAVPASEPAGTAHDVTVQRVRNMAQRHDGPVAICCDAPRNWRYELLPSYKANRESKGEGVIAQIARLRETLALDGFAVWRADGFEADDLLATAVREATARGIRCTLATHDKDLVQLVGPTVAIRSLRTDVDMGEAEVVSKYGVTPRQFADYLALVGDTADNVPGVPGIGPKRAADLLRAWGDLPTLMAAVEDPAEPRVDDKMRAKLLEHAERLALARRLVGLRDDAPIDFEEAMRERVTKPLPSQRDDQWEGREAEEDDVDQGNDNGQIIDATVEEIPRAADSQTRPVETDQQRADVSDSPTQQTASQTHAITLVRPGSDEWSLALEPMNGPDAWRLAGHLFNSRVFGGFPNREAVFAAVMLGRTLGVPAATIARSVHIVEGRLTLSAQFIVGLVLKSGKASFFKCVETSPTKATWKTHRKGDPDPQATVITWTVEDAQRAGLVKKGGNWEKYPSQMMRWRAGVDLARLVFADVVGGLYCPDELDAEHHSIGSQVAA